MNISPKVSVVIPVYNGSNYLREAIDAALSQTYQNIEILVVNDGSSDNGATTAIALSYAEKIKYFEKENGGVSSALNFGIRQMTGDYFSWLSHDDLYVPEKIETQIEMLASLGMKRDVILYSDYANKIEIQNKINKVQLTNTAPEAFRYRVAVGNDLHGCTMLIPKSAFDNFGFFDEKLRAVQDYEMWFRLSNHYSFIHIPKVLVIGRVHGQQVGVRLKGLALKENLAFREKCLMALNAKDITQATGKKEWSALLDTSEIFLKRRLYPTAGAAIKISISKAWQSGAFDALSIPFHVARAVVRGGLLACYGVLRQQLAYARSQLGTSSK